MRSTPRLNVKSVPVSGLLSRRAVHLLFPCETKKIRHIFRCFCLRLFITATLPAFMPSSFIVMLSPSRAIFMVESGGPASSPTSLSTTTDASLLHLPGQPNRLPLSYQIYRTTLYCRSYPSFTRQLPWLLLLPFTGNPDALPIGITSFTDPPVDRYLIKCGANHSNDIILTSLEIPSPRIS